MGLPSSYKVLDLTSPFGLIYQGNTSNLNIDASWQLAFQWTGKSYTCFYRETNYVFESEQQTGFFVDNYKTNFDFVTNTVIKDKITVLSINEKTGTNLPFCSTYFAVACKLESGCPRSWLKSPLIS